MDLPIGFLVLPAAGERSVATLRRKLGLVALHALLSTRPAETPRGADAVRRLLRWLGELLSGSDKGAVRDAMQSEDVLVPLLAAKSGLLSLDDALDDAVPSLLLEIAARARSALPSLVWDRGVSQVFDGSRGRHLLLPSPALGLTVDGRVVELELGSGARVSCTAPTLAGAEPYLHAISELAPSRLATRDSNPLFALEEHPDKSGNAVDLAGRDLGEWRAGLSGALGLVAGALPALAQELTHSLLRVIPVGYEPERHLSASYREAPGQIYMTLHPSELTMAEAIVHETQHGKLNLLRWFDPILKNGDSVWTESAVRPDLRPLTGVLLAVHAFVPVAALHAALARSRHAISDSAAFQERRRAVLAANARGLETLGQLAEPTELGARMLADLRELHAALEDDIQGSIPAGRLEDLG